MRKRRNRKPPPKRRRENRSGLLIFILLLAVALGAFSYHRMSAPLRRPVRFRPPAVKHEVKVEVKENLPDSPTESWTTFTKSIKAKCAKPGANASLDYDLLHDYKGDKYGITVIARKESEYEIDLYRFDKVSATWEESPIIEGETTMIDTKETSKKWNLPEKTVKVWIDKTDKLMQKKYGNGEQ